MGGVNRDGGRWGGEQAADQSGSWSVDRDDLWTWIAEALERVAATAIDAAGLEALCGQVLDTPRRPPLCMPKQQALRSSGLSRPALW